MIAPKLLMKEPNKAAKIVILEINSESSRKIKNNRINYHKLKKLHLHDPNKPSRGIKSFDKLDFNDFLKENQALQQETNLSPPKNHHQSAYLAYKAQQKHNKVKHTNKSNFLRNRLLQHKYSLDTRPEAKPKQNQPYRTIQTFDISRNRRKMSMVLLGQCISEGNEDLSALNHSKNIYIKTSQGKRQKINANTYISKIKEKIQILSERQAPNNGFSLVNLWGDSDQMSIRVNQQFNADRHTMGRNIRTRNIKKQAACLKVDDNANDCRPWTSNKSEAPQQ